MRTTAIRTTTLPCGLPVEAVYKMLPTPSTGRLRYLCGFESLRVFYEVVLGFFGTFSEVGPDLRCRHDPKCDSTTRKTRPRPRTSSTPPLTLAKARQPASPLSRTPPTPHPERTGSAPNRCRGVWARDRAVLAEVQADLKRLADHFDPPPSDIVDTPYIAHRLGLTTARIAQLVRSGEIPKGCVVPGSGRGSAMEVLSSPDGRMAGQTVDGRT